jgi:hypothetical protein
MENELDENRFASEVRHGRKRVRQELKVEETEYCAKRKSDEGSHSGRLHNVYDYLIKND